MIPPLGPIGCLNWGCDTVHTHRPNPDSDRKTGFFDRVVMGFFDGHYVDRKACDSAFLRMHQRDSIGDRVHVIFACFGLIAMFGPVTLTEIAFAPLMVFFFVRVLNTFPVWIHGFGQPVVLAVLALAGWMMLSLRWSGDPAHGWDEISELRWFVLVGLIFPAIEKRKVLIAAMCIGIAIAQLAQILDAFDGFGIEPLASLVQNHPGRIAGWWHPVVGGSILVGALGLHLPAALIGTGRSRVFGVLGSSAIIVGIIATGTRGAWIASVLLIVLSVLIGAITRRIRWKRVLILAGALVVLAIVAAMLMGDGLRDRLDETRTELAQIMDGQYDSYTGLRIRMGQVALEAGVEHPLVGVGAGGYQHWSNEQYPESKVHAHAHNSLLQIWSTLGIVGVVLWTIVLIAMLRASWRIWDQRDEGLYGIGPMFAILGLILASLTDSIELNTQTAAMLGALAALSPAYRPRLGPEASRSHDNRPIGEYTGVPESVE